MTPNVAMLAALSDDYYADAALWPTARLQMLRRALAADVRSATLHGESTAFSEERIRLIDRILARRAEVAP